MNLSPTTFGKTPAALYLVRELNTENNPVLVRNVGSSITATNTAVRDIISAYTAEIMSPKTAAHCLRLMRLDVTQYDEDGVLVDGSLIGQLTRNVRIGIIKRGLRVCNLARKAERVMATTHQRVKGVAIEHDVNSTTETYTFRDGNSGVVHEAGSVTVYHDNLGVEYKHLNRFDLNSVQDVTPELLMERSKRRIARRGLRFVEE